MKKLILLLCLSNPMAMADSQSSLPLEANKIFCQSTKMDIFPMSHEIVMNSEFKGIIFSRYKFENGNEGWTLDLKIKSVSKSPTELSISTEQFEESGVLASLNITLQKKGQTTFEGEGRFVQADGWERLKWPLSCLAKP